MQFSQILQASASEVQTSEHSGLAYPIVRFRKRQLRNVEDTLAVEEPLEIRLCHGPTGARKIKSLSVTMRTPGNDCELAAGFLATEAVIRDSADIQSIDWIACQPSARSATALSVSPSGYGGASRYNTLQVSASLLGDQFDNRNQPRTSFPYGAWSHRPTDVAAHIRANTSPARPTTSTADNNSSRLAEEDWMFLIGGNAMQALPPCAGQRWTGSFLEEVLRVEAFRCRP
jgi:hypothetical protein